MSWSLVLQMGGGMSGAWSVGFLGPLFGVLIVAILGYLLWSAIVDRQPSPDRPTGSDRAMDTLRERYARGEIDEDVFEERARRLREQ